MPVPVSGFETSLSGCVSGPDTFTLNAMQKLEAVQDEVHQLMQIHARLTQEVEEATDQLKKVLVSTQDLMDQRRSLQGELSVPEPVSVSDDSSEVTE